MNWIDVLLLALLGVSVAAYAAARLWESGRAHAMWSQFRSLGVLRQAALLVALGWSAAVAQKCKVPEQPGGDAGAEEARAGALGGEEGPLRGGAGAPEGRVTLQAAVGFDGAAAGGPVRLEAWGGAGVRCVMLSCNGEAADLATLVDAPWAARLRVAECGGLEPAMGPAEASLTGQYTSGGLGPEAWRVVLAEFDGPVSPRALRFGDTAGRAAWGRRWRGRIAEAVLFDGMPGGDVRAGVANWLASRQGAGWRYPATAAQRRAAAAAGLNPGADWATLIILR